MLKFLICMLMSGTPDFPGVSWPDVGISRAPCGVIQVSAHCDFMPPVRHRNPPVNLCIDLRGFDKRDEVTVKVINVRTKEVWHSDIRYGYNLNNGHRFFSRHVGPKWKVNDEIEVKITVRSRQGKFKFTERVKITATH